MNRYIVLTESESGDKFTYYIACEDITKIDMQAWLDINGNDPGYEYVGTIEKLPGDDEFKIIRE